MVADLSLWLPVPPVRRPPLPGDRDVDVAIVGAGYTGLWTAYYLAIADPGLRIAVLEAEFAGYGASGRNGGWCSALFPRTVPGMHRALVSTVDEVGRVAAAEGIDCDYAKGGSVVLARNRPQLRRARAVAAADADTVLLTAEEARDRCAATGVLGGTYTPHCAALHPGKLVRGLADAVERHGVAVYESTPVVRIGRSHVDTPHGTVQAPVVVRATEGYTPTLPGLRRVLLPVYSLMIATEPLPASVWSTIGLAARETFADYWRLIVYGQRTTDGRLAFGGRGAPYHFGSAVKPGFDRVPAVFAALRAAVGELFPALRDVRIDHSWGGPLGVPRDWMPSVGLDRGLGWAGGYVGDGVAAANLAGRCLAALITGTERELTALPWVGHRSRRWEPEPLRWLGVNAARWLAASADRVERPWSAPRRDHA